MGDYVKHVRNGPPGATAWEAAGLAWLAEAMLADVIDGTVVDPTAQGVCGGARVVAVRGVTEQALTLERLSPASPSAAHLEDFGRRLAATHDAGAPAFGAGPPAWEGDGYLGPADELLPLPLTHHDTWGEFYGESRIAHTLSIARQRGLWQDATVFDPVIARLTSGEFDDGSPPARLHGDLWSGNVVWTADGGVLIDPAAHGGHRLTDLAMLVLFGGDREDRVIGAYQDIADLPDDWRDLVGLHQLHPLMLHAVLFGGGYIGRAETVARRYG